MTHANRDISEGPEEPFAMKLHVVHKSREVRLTLAGNFDASETIKQMCDLLHPAGYYERIVLDFSQTSGARPSELYRLFTELSQCPDFNYLEICIEGLEFGYERGKTKYLKN